jgi:TrmH family RNA methyltransferase
MRQTDVLVQVPMSGAVESLNVGVATGISLYELKLRLVLLMLTNYIRANFGREVNVTGTLIVRAFDTRLREVSDLNSTQVILMMMLVFDRALTPEQVARETATYGEELQFLLEPLYVKGYIRSTGTPEDEHIALTAAGERALAQLWSVVEKAENDVLAGFSEDEREQTWSYLKRIQENCARVIDNSTES